jgi:hypothetical protein
MDGPFHFREAERLIEKANDVGHRDPQRGDGILLAAHVHATLALAAATALTGSMAAQSYTDEPEIRAWHEAAGAECEPSPEPGQVEPEPAAPVRIDSLFGQIKSEEITVSHPDWNGGKPVLLTELHDRFDARVDVTYGVPETRDYASVTVPADTLVTPYGGAQ